MKEIREELKRLNEEVGRIKSDIKFNEYKYGKELAESLNEIRKEKLDDYMIKIKILETAENILLGIE